MELRKKSILNENKSIFSKRQERVQMQVDLANISHITSLLTDLYVNPIEATVRETVSNAIDTTRRLPEDKRKPITINLPTEFNPEFVVTDFGEGMDRETLSMVFAQYGASTKGTDLSQIGAFGLGAKAPLSYASKFSVESTKDGITTEVFLSSTNEGNFCDVLESKHTGKPNGTTVTIPVNVDNKRDFDSFANAVEDNYLKYSYDVELDIKGLGVTPSYNTVEMGEIKVGEVNGEDVYSKLYMVQEKRYENDIITIIEENFRNDIATFVEHNVGFTLSGWNYTLKTSYCPQYFLELVPGMVDFSSSRDEITQNERFFAVKKLIEEQIKDVILNKIEEIVASFDWENLSTYRLLGYIDSDVFPLINKTKKNGKTIKERVYDFNSTIIPLEFGINFPLYKSGVFKIYTSDGSYVSECTITETKERIKSLKNDTRITMESLLLNLDQISIITDIPKEKSDKEQQRTKDKLVNKLRRFNYDERGDHYSGITYVGTTMSYEEVESIIKEKDLTNVINPFSYDDIQENYGAIKKSKVSKKGERKQILSSRNYFDVLKLPRIFPVNTELTHHQLENTLSFLISDKYKNILVVAETNDYTDVESLRRKLFFYAMEHSLEKINFIFVRRTALKGQIAKDLIDLVDYTIQLCSSSKLSKEIDEKLKEKSFDNVTVVEKINISTSAKLFMANRDFSYFKEMEKFAKKYSLDLNLLISDDLIEKTRDIISYKLTPEEEAYLNYIEGEELNQYKELDEVILSSNYMIRELELIFDFNYQKDFYNGLMYLDTAKEIVKIAYEQLVPKIKEDMKKKMTK